MSIDELRSSPQLALWHQAGRYAEKPAGLWPGGDEQSSPKSVIPLAEALVAITHREGDIACGKLDEVRLLLEDRDGLRVEAHITSTVGAVTATQAGAQIAREMKERTVRQVYDHYLEKYGGANIYLLSREDMERTAEMMAREEGRTDGKQTGP